MDPLVAASKIAQSGMNAQSERLRVIAENLANANSTARTAGGDPYTRKTIGFRADFDEYLGVDRVAVSDIGRHQSPFRVEYDPGHPAADDKGYVKYPNVEPLVELADMREANRSYLANLQLVKNAREAIAAVIDLLRGAS